MKKLFITMLAAALAVSLLAGCGSGQQGGSDAQTSAQGSEQQSSNSAKENMTAEAQQADNEAEKGDYYDDLLIIATNGGPSTMNPYSTGNEFKNVHLNIFENLGASDDKGNLKLVMLKSVTEVDELTYDCELWDFIYDTAGNNITASDVAWSVDQKIAAAGNGEVSRLDHIEVTGDYTFTWHNNEPFAIGEFTKQFGNFVVCSQKSYEADPDEMASNPVGTGPYKLKEFSEGSYGLYEVNEDYWWNNITDEAWLAENKQGWNYQNYKEIRIDIISDGTARAIALENNEVACAATLNAADAKEYENNDDIVLFNRPNSSPIAFYFNVGENSPCSDVNLRKAICYAIDNAAVAASMDIPAFPCYGIHPLMYDAPESWSTGVNADPYYDYNVDTAKEYLEKSSYNGELLKLCYQSDSNKDPAWIYFQAACHDVGINIDLVGMEKSAFDNLQSDFTSFDIRSHNLGGGSYLPNTLRWFYAGNNIMDPNNPKMTILGIEEPTLDGLYEDLSSNHSDETIQAWVDYAVDEQCYVYSMINFADAAACRSDYRYALVGSHYNVCPQAFAPAE